MQTFKATLPRLRDQARSLLELRLPRSHPPRVVRNLINPVNSESLSGRDLENFFERLRNDLIQEIRQIVDEIDRDCASEIQDFIDEATSSLEFSEMFTTDVPITKFSPSAFPEEETIEAPNFSADFLRRLGRSIGPSLYPAGFAAYMTINIATGGTLTVAIGAAAAVGLIFGMNAYLADKRHHRENNERKIKDELTHIAYDASAVVTQYFIDSLEKTGTYVVQGLEDRKENVEKKIALMKHHNSNIDYEKVKAEINILIKSTEELLGSGHTANRASGNR